MENSCDSAIILLVIGRHELPPHVFCLIRSFSAPVVCRTQTKTLPYTRCVSFQFSMQWSTMAVAIFALTIHHPNPPIGKRSPNSCDDYRWFREGECTSFAIVSFAATRQYAYVREIRENLYLEELVKKDILVDSLFSTVYVLFCFVQILEGLWMLNKSDGYT